MRNDRRRPPPSPISCYSSIASTCDSWIFIVLLLLFSSSCNAQQQESPLTMNGGSVLAMAGKNCVVVAMDRRIGKGPAFVTTNDNNNNILTPSSQTLIAFTGLQGDVHSLRDELDAILHSQSSGILTAASDNHQVSPALLSNPASIASLTSHVLYQQRMRSPYYVEPIVVGLERKSRNGGTVSGTSSFEPFLSSMDMIGAQSTSRKFVCAGVMAEGLWGTAEAGWKEDLESPEELCQVCLQAFVRAMERNCVSGYGIHLYLITPDEGIQQFTYSTRND